ncbi:PorT family protein [Mucilaginibacter sp. UR6-1]|uniref:porin family protein n=1 Tax=Mucilaginibacter sp. UR6-1 TaxID=1435643 RepID=UPI001E5FE8F9|nr:porin family protein [Mucilaginibacter sp. UR6-1]MCC8408121.1 PorT family protein [Mucilaginibacter sp. UR6-1]
MKKISIICAFIMLASVHHSFAQSLLKRLEFGLKAGGNVSNFTNADFPTDPLYGFHGGVTVAFKVTNNFLIQEDILFSTQGAKIKGGALGTQDLKLDYVTLPFLLKYRGNSGLFIEAGPQFGMKINEKIEGVNTDNFAKKVDLAAVGGIGYQSKLGLGISARYVYGLSKVADFNISDISNDYKNNTIQASLFYVF